MIFPFRVIACLFCLVLTATAAEPPGGKLHFEFVDTISLPDVVVDGHPAHVHTQGLYVTDQHFLVTGRLETKPKRAWLIRFSREHPRRVEHLDITPELAGKDVVLDHPGGFDRDARGLYQIPVSTSHRRGPTLIQGYRVFEDRPLREAKLESTLAVDDHLGAVCCHAKTLIAANWDTVKIYFIRDGKIVKEIRQAQTLNRGDPHIAVQDWKAWKFADPVRGQPNGQTTLLGGLVKEQASQAIVQLADLSTEKILATQRFPLRADVARPVTNEGLAVHDGDLYLLPEDIGRGAKLLRFRIVNM